MLSLSKIINVSKIGASGDEGKIVHRCRETIRISCHKNGLDGLRRQICNLIEIFLLWYVNIIRLI